MVVITFMGGTIMQLLFKILYIKIIIVYLMENYQFYGKDYIIIIIIVILRRALDKPNAKTKKLYLVIYVRYDICGFCTCLCACVRVHECVCVCVYV